MTSATIECVGPLCCRIGNRMSASGIMESVSTSGMLKLVLDSLEDALLAMYPKAKCPTAKRSCFLLLSPEKSFRVIKVYSEDWVASGRQHFLLDRITVDSL
jgi:hypothetical protein